LTVANRAVPGKDRAELTSESFNRLLGWLARDREGAGRRYEEIRSRLIKIFVCRGCSTPEDLADQTINRVAGKLEQIESTYVGNPALYFYGVAEKIFLEHVRRESVPLRPVPPYSNEDAETKYECLEQCMDGLSMENRELILAYYGGEEGSKIRRRKDLAGQRGLGANALWIRAHRIRESLKRCVSRCITQRKARDVSAPADAARYFEEY
jgi:DNA-directed RNA polymerase specialized sigma24 family protein